ncbi:cholecystokinin receptor-like [Saccostrea echinata]|uniref:cholecystokinin receptor-like n=1 Tax=Saccostrea echinata TaxID=191078 RepID=UPI002A815D47|nr:cholecystokinin receptor-like [Saccostrea echinata]
MKSRSWCTSGNTHKIFATVWIISIILSSPAFYIMNVKYKNFHNNVSSVTLTFCDDSHVSEQFRIVFSFCKLILMFAIPTVIMAVCYTGVIYALWVSSAQLTKLTTVPRGPGGDRVNRQLVRYSSVYSDNNTTNKPCCIKHDGSLHQSHTLNARKQIIKMLIAVVLVFLICWGPKLIFDVISKMAPEILFYNEVFRIKIAIECLPYIQSCVNPFVYCFMSKKFRESIRMSCRSAHLECHLQACFCHTGVRDNISQHFELESKGSQGTGQTRLTTNRPNTSRSASSTDDPFNTDKRDQVF